ncbi:MAG: nucleoside hydrolase [Candidatus Electrothrix sp. ATG2]|nr:nucleoside hydrolase [Candidatus Electrothrix sp. ATG2]
MTATGLLLLMIMLSGCKSNNLAPGKVPILILDTDLSSDVDDVGAVALLHGLADQGKVRILAMMVSSGDPWSVPCLNALNTWFGRPAIPVGMVGGNSIRHESKYTRTIAEEFSGSRIESAPPAAVKLYRRLLATQQDRSVTLVTIGYLTNLSDLLQSKPDKISPLNGSELVLQKVKHLVCMGGEYPSGREWNFYQDAAATDYVITYWPTPIIFSGFEIGRNILTGAGLHNTPHPNPVRRSYELYNGLSDRPSWDQVAVYYAVTAASEQKTTSWSKVYGRNMIKSDGSNFWVNKQEKTVMHSYLVQRTDNEEIAGLIEQLMLVTRQKKN